LISIPFGLLSALAWGAADFAGGIASRKTGAYRAVLYGEGFGLVLIVAAAVIVRQPTPAWTVWVLAGVAGAIGSIGLLLLFRAFTEGMMSIAAPVSALLAAILPVVVGAFTEGLPSPWTFLGFGFALTAVWLISRAEGNDGHILAHLSDLRLPLIAGIGFGLYFILLHAATRQATLWPMVASRSGGALAVVLYMAGRKDSWRVERAVWPFIALNGILDIGGNALYILAGQAGRLDVSAVLSSLYPGATVILPGVPQRTPLAQPVARDSRRAGRHRADDTLGLEAAT